MSTYNVEGHVRNQKPQAAPTGLVPDVATSNDQQPATDEAQADSLPAVRQSQQGLELTLFTLLIPEVVHGSIDHQSRKPLQPPAVLLTRHNA